MAFERYVYVNGKKLRCGFTTGTCAAIASKAAVKALLEGQVPLTCSVLTPKNIEVDAEIINGAVSENFAICSVIKDGGDDIDATNGLEIVVKAEKIKSGIVINGGKGVGRITKSGLDQPVGNAAINSVPLKMIRENVLEICRHYNYMSGIKITVSVPEGERVAAKTFNPNIGIEGGISIIGTSGIVEPRSVRAIVETIKLEINVIKSSKSKSIAITLGNYGESFLIENEINIPYVKCSNFIGEAIDEAVKKNFDNILVVGHLGKLIKLAGNMFNTHSDYGDCRMEIFGVHAAMCGADNKLIKNIMECVTIDAAISVIEYDKELLRDVINSIIERIQFYIEKRVGNSFNKNIGVIVFTNKYGILGKSLNVDYKIKNNGG